MNANMEWRLRLDRDYHKLPAPMTLTPQRMAGLRLLAAQLAAGYETGPELLELRQITGIPAMEWTSYILGKAEMPLAKVKRVADVLGVLPDYLLGCTDYFGQQLELADGNLYLPPWMMLHEERIVSNAAFLRRVTTVPNGPLTNGDISAMMNDRSVSDVDIMFSHLPRASGGGNASFYKAAAYRPVATRFEMLCLRYHLIHKHGVDAAACLPQLGDDFSDVEAVFDKKKAPVKRPDSAGPKAPKEPVQYRQFDTKIANLRVDLPNLPASWTAACDDLVAAVKAKKVVLKNGATFPRPQVCATLSRLCLEKGVRLKDLTDRIAEEKLAKALLQTRGVYDLQTLLHPANAEYPPITVNIILVVAVMATLGVTAEQLLPAIG